MTDPQPARRFRFGLFEADADTGELRRQGVAVKLHAQPFQLLLLLLERPGALLTREQIARALWPDGTFVDYEHGVNSAVNRLREALGDTAANPRFVATLARRGYRFVAPVERIGADQTASANGITASQPAQPEEGADSAAAASAPSLDSTPQRKPRSRILASTDDLPRTSYPIVQTLFVLLQLMYLGFYVGALGNLTEIGELFSGLPHPALVMNMLIVTAAALIPVRAFTLCAALFHAPSARQKFLTLWPFLFVLDVLWSLSPFLLLHHINFGLAIACTALLVYSPFAQRALILMGAGGAKDAASAVAR